MRDPTVATARRRIWIFGPLLLFALPACSGPDGRSEPGLPTLQERWEAFESARSDSSFAEALDFANAIVREYPDTEEATLVGEMLPALTSAAQAEAQAIFEEAYRVRAEEESARRLREAQAKWTYLNIEDPMSSREIRGATIRSENTVSLSFPYQGAQRANLVLREHPTAGRNVILTIERGQILCRANGRCHVSIRFDDRQAVNWPGSPPLSLASEEVFIANHDSFLRQVRNAKRILIQVELYQDGRQVFEFDVSGFQPERYIGG